jgi:hypothetical protein
LGDWKADENTLIIKKKFFLIAVIAMFSLCINAQENLGETISKSVERMKNLKELTEKMPKATGVADVDGFGQDVYNAAITAMANSEQLENFYKREIGETQDGVTDVTVTKPTLEDWVTLGATLTAEGASIKAAADKGTKAAEAVKGVKNPLAAGKLAKMMKWTKDVLPVITEESVNQAQAVSQIISTLKSGGNL